MGHTLPPSFIYIQEGTIRLVAEIEYSDLDSFKECVLNENDLGFDGPVVFNKERYTE